MCKSGYGPYKNTGVNKPHPRKHRLLVPHWPAVACDFPRVNALPDTVVFQQNNLFSGVTIQPRIRSNGLPYGLSSRIRVKIFCWSGIPQLHPKIHSLHSTAFFDRFFFPNPPSRSPALHPFNRPRLVLLTTALDCDSRSVQRLRSTPCGLPFGPTINGRPHSLTMHDLSFVY
jgi:hypothetical protein